MDIQINTVIPVITVTSTNTTIKFSMPVYSAARNYYAVSLSHVKMPCFNIWNRLCTHPYLPNPIMIIHSVGTANHRHKRLFLSMQLGIVQRVFGEISTSSDNNIVTFYFPFLLHVARFIVIILHFVWVPRRARYS